MVVVGAEPVVKAWGSYDAMVRLYSLAGRISKLASAPARSFLVASSVELGFLLLVTLPVREQSSTTYEADAAHSEGAEERLFHAEIAV